MVMTPRARIAMRAQSGRVVGFCGWSEALACGTSARVPGQLVPAQELRTREGRRKGGRKLIFNFCIDCVMQSSTNLTSSIAGS